MVWVSLQRGALYFVLATATLVVLAELFVLSSKRQIFARRTTAYMEEEKALEEQEGREPLPMIFMITPTYNRPTQVPDMTRLCQTLMHVKSLFWIVVEDDKELSQNVADILNWCSVNSTYLSHKTPVDRLGQRGTGADQRNHAMQWLRERYQVGQLPGVVYFGDDDNTYDIRLFEEMRHTRKVSIWPVGFAAHKKVESPICKGGQVVGFQTGFKRKFSVDMAGFAVNLDLILRKVTDFNVRVGYLESDFLNQLVTLEELEPVANCTEVYVWHTKTANPDFSAENSIDPS